MSTSGNVMHELSPKKKGSKSSLVIVIIFALVLGVASAFITTRLFGSASLATITSGGSGAEKVDPGDIVGSDDLETYSDEAEGTLKKGGIEGEGAYHLERPGGESQNVYLTSSTVDLSQFVGKKVKVWGQTNSAQTAGWLMEVGRLQLVE